MALRAKGRWWSFTLNATEEDTLEHPRLEVGDDVAYYIYQLERGEAGRRHFQGALRLTRPQGMTWVKRLLGDRAHVEVARDPQKLVQYCRKAETRIEGPWEAGEVVGVKRSRRDEMARAVVTGRSLADVAAEDPGTFVSCYKGLTELQSLRDRPVYRNAKTFVLQGSTGIGKSLAASKLFPNAYRLFNAVAPWFDGYAGEDCIIIEEMGPDMMSIDFFKQLTDCYKMRLPVKGSSVWNDAKTIIITTNYGHVGHWYPKATEANLSALLRRLTWIRCDLDQEFRKGVKQIAKWKNDLIAVMNGNRIGEKIDGWLSPMQKGSVVLQQTHCSGNTVGVRRGECTLTVVRSRQSCSGKRSRGRTVGS